MTGNSPKLKPFPEARAEIEIEAIIDADAFPLIRAGYVPQTEADKWLITMDDDLWLRVYRTASGSCIFMAKFAADEEAYAITEAWVNRSPAEYRSQDVVYDARLFVFLLRRLLLKHPVPFPQPAALPHQNKTVHEKHVMGQQDDQRDSFIPLDLVD